MILRLSVDLPQDRSYIKIIRLLGRTLLEHLKVVEKDIDDIEIVVGELCANVIRHSQSTDGRFQIGLEYAADRVGVVVEDKGKGFSFRDVPEVGSKRPDFGGGERLGGFGLQIIETLADRLEFHRTDPHGTTVRAEKLLHYQSPADAAEARRFSDSSGGAAHLSDNPAG
jgi:anti-sigma regulatory factor (Ser/Thr protein kinase)